MNYIIGDSRVRGLRRFVPNIEFAEIWSQSGGKVSDMFQWVEDLTILHHGEENSRAHFYVWIGICNLTKRLKGDNYEEVIFNKSDFQIQKSNLYREVENLSVAVRNQYAVPIFCTIPPLSLQMWNHHRLSIHKTVTLNYDQNYPQMQHDLESEVSDLNDLFVRINRRNGVTTPMLHRDLEHSKGKGRKIYKYNMLSDGCHLNRSALLKCKNSIMIAYGKNKNRLR